MPQKKVWDYIEEYVSEELRDLQSIFPHIIYDINTNGIRFASSTMTYAPKDLMRIGEITASIRSKIIGLLEDGKVKVEEL